MDKFRFSIRRKSQCWCDICQQGQLRALPWLSGGTQGLPFFLCRFLSGSQLQRETNFLDSCWVGLGFSPAVHTWMMLCSCFIRYCVCVCTRVCLCEHLCVPVYVLHIGLCFWMYLCKFACVCMYVCLVCLCACVCVSLCAYTYYFYVYALGIVFMSFCTTCIPDTEVRREY